MTPQEILNEIDAHGFQDTDINEKLRAINASIHNITARKPWPWLHKVASLTFDGTNPYPIIAPSDSRAALKMIDTSNGRRVRYKSVDEIEEQYGNQLTSQGSPYFYYFEGTQLRVWQVPGATQTLRYRYIRIHPTVLQNDPESAILIPVYGHEAIVFRAIMRLADLEDDSEIAARFGGLFDQEMQQIEEAFVVQQFDTPEHVLVMDEDDFYYDL